MSGYVCENRASKTNEQQKSVQEISSKSIEFVLRKVARGLEIEGQKLIRCSKSSTKITSPNHINRLRPFPEKNKLVIINPQAKGINTLKFTKLRCFSIITQQKWRNMVSKGGGREFKNRSRIARRPATRGRKLVRRNILSKGEGRVKLRYQCHARGYVDVYNYISASCTCDSTSRDRVFQKTNLKHLTRELFALRQGGTADLDVATLFRGFCRNLQVSNNLAT